MTDERPLSGRQQGKHSDCQEHSLGTCPGYLAPVGLMFTISHLQEAQMQVTCTGEVLLQELRVRAQALVLASCPPEACTHGEGKAAAPLRGTKFPPDPHLSTPAPPPE